MAPCPPPVSFYGAVPIRLASETRVADESRAPVAKTKLTSSLPPSDEVFAPGDVLKSSSSTRPTEKRTLWLGDLECADSFADEDYVRNHMFFEFQYCIRNIRICKDRVTGQPSYGFIEFSNQMQAQYVLDHMSGRFVPGRSHKYKLNWANFNLTERTENKVTYSNPPVLNAEKAEEGKKIGNCNPCNGESFSIWVGSLDPATTREDIEDLFLQKYKSVCFVKVVLDPSTGLGRGFAFVHFRDETESERALLEMNGAICRGKRIRVNRSNTKNAPSKSSQGQGDRSFQQGSTGSYSAGSGFGYFGLGGTAYPDATAQSALNKLYMASAAKARQIASDFCGGSVPTKRKRGILQNGEPTRVVVRGLDVRCTEQQLQSHFDAFGEILQLKIVAGKKASISFAEPNAALNAVLYMNGAFIGEHQVFLDLVDHEGVAAEMMQPFNDSRIRGAIDGAYADDFYGKELFQSEIPISDGKTPYSGTSYWQEAPQYPEHHLIAQSSGAQGGPGSSAQGFNRDRHSADAPHSSLISATEDTIQQLPCELKLRSNAGGRLHQVLRDDTVDDVGFFSDSDPCMIPAEMLPQKTFEITAMTSKGTMERHIFDSFLCIEIKIDMKKDEKDSLKVANEDSAIMAAIRSRQSRKLHRRKVDNTLRPEDFETLYSSAFYHDWDFS